MDQEQREAQTLHKLLNAPKVPEDLAAKLKNNLEKQMVKPEQLGNTARRYRKWVYGLAASLTIAIVVAVQIKTEPELVSLAYRHAEEEAHLVGAIDGGYQSWFDKAGLQIPSEANAIVLSKNCALGEQKTKHLRFDLPNKGTINLFLYQDGAGLPGRVQADGTIDGQSWISISPREDIRLLALYDSTVSKAKITQIIQSMFEEHSA
ncbi:MAG: hypothetical protein PVF82_11290 [Gammaproteobacteria bacterium]|jgi:hypothetical protein